MYRHGLLIVCGIAICVSTGSAYQTPSSGPYSVIKTSKVEGAGGLDYVYADNAGRRLYVPRGGMTQGAAGRISVFNLDTLEQVGEIPNASARGVAVDPASHHGFATSKPVVMWDTTSLATIKTIDVQGGPDGILFDPFNARIWILSHSAPNVTLINAADGSIAGTIDLGGAPEQAQSDGKGTVYVDLEDKDAIAVVDAKAMKVTATYDISAKGGGPAGLGLDNKNHVLFATCHSAGKDGAQGTASMVVVSATDGKILASLPIGAGTDGGGFNANTMEAFSSNGQAATLSVIKENSPTSFVVEQELKTVAGAKTMTIDTKANHVLMIAGEYGPAPTPTAAPTTPPARGGRAPRGPMLGFSILVAGK